MLTSEDLRLGINAFTLICRETKVDTLELTYDKILRAFRLLGKAISVNTLAVWFDRCHNLLECVCPSQVEFQKYPKVKELEFNLKHRQKL